MDFWDKLCVSCFGITILLGFIAAGVWMYQWIGYFSLLVLSVFIFLSVAGIVVHDKETKKQALKDHGIM